MKNFKKLIMIAIVAIMMMSCNITSNDEIYDEDAIHTCAEYNNEYPTPGDPWCEEGDLVFRLDTLKNGVDYQFQYRDRIEFVTTYFSSNTDHNDQNIMSSQGVVRYAGDSRSLGTNDPYQYFVGNVEGGIDYYLIIKSIRLGNAILLD